MPVSTESEFTPSTARLLYPAPSTFSSQWITESNARHEYGVFLFRCPFQLALPPKRFVIRVSADNRYQLFINGKRIARGPARGSIEHWRYETLEISEYLRGGENLLAAVVWNHGAEAPLAQMSLRTGLLIDGETEFERALVNTGRARWRCLRATAYTPVELPPMLQRKFTAVGKGERLDARRHPWNWQTRDFSDAEWADALALFPATSHADPIADNLWMLEPRSIPLMEETVERLQRIRQSQGIDIPARFPKERESLQIPANSNVAFLLDQAYLTTAYPRLVVSGGKGALIRLEYAENLWIEPELKTKGHRDDIEGMHLVGILDEFVPDGGSQRVFEPLWWRTYRYLRVTIETQGEALTIEDIVGLTTSYPLVRRAEFSSEEPELLKMLDVGWRTARLCAHETYVDCPYYEQLQYSGDTRVQAMVSLYMSGDDRLVRNAILQFDDSRSGDGLTTSRYPTSSRQYIPQFSLLWIGMIHDHLRYQDDREFVRRFLPGVRQVLGVFEELLLPEGCLGKMPYWAYFDWANEWSGGVPPGWSSRPSWTSKPGPGVPLTDPRGASALFDFLLAMASDWAADIEREVGSPEFAARYVKIASMIRSQAKDRYFSRERQLFADTAALENFSQHANTLAVLAGIVKGEEGRSLMERVLEDGSLVKASIHWLYYVHLALRDVGLGDRYLQQLDPWRRMLGRGLTTWEEVEEPSRSECHAWGSSPNVELFRIVLGIDSASPGWKRVLIAPALGKLLRASGRVPHPRGEIGLKLTREGSALLADVDLPPEVSGELIWGGKVVQLLPGLSQHRIDGAE